MCFFVVAVSSPLSIPKHSWQTMASHQRSSRYPKLLPTVVGLSRNRFAPNPPSEACFAIKMAIEGGI